MARPCQKRGYAPPRLMCSHVEKLNQLSTNLHHPSSLIIAFAGRFLRDTARPQVRLQGRVSVRARLRPALRTAHLRGKLIGNTDLKGLLIITKLLYDKTRADSAKLFEVSARSIRV